MCKCRSHGTFPLFGLQSSHLNICDYHQDPHQRPLHPGSRLRFCSDRCSLLLIGAWHLPRRPGIGRTLKCHPFSGLVDLVGELLHSLADFDFHDHRPAVLIDQHPLWVLGIVHHLSGLDRHAHTRTLLRRSRSVDGATHGGDPTNQLPCALQVYSPVDSHTCETPWSVFQDGPNGEPTSRCRERADAEARQGRTLPATIKAKESPQA
ncbi:hypothetical protein Vadar_010599 [Vaccinium darrowii]|uniref:Uncharacterized protein n=1 Tax=Vaccinium darrowii TaxID=229202 RepID=A0ACB7ZID5_9ERIC|nr:hypothetical protein Vadar_010599 [Vaccinium darrowii]